MSTLSKNRKAYHDYEILEEFEAGMVLNGQEVKAIKKGKISLKGAYIVIREEEAFLIGVNIPPYQPKNAPDDYDPKRSRKLLLTKKQIKYLMGKSNERGLTLVPLKVYTKKGLIKLKFGVCRGKKKYDKRKKIKDREVDRNLRRRMKRNR
ncbi:MAG: SsrA-binding protein SmpB [Patescibacteria group bacterium]